MAEMSLHRALIILSIFAWCACVNGEPLKQLNCEKYVFHPNCRGMQARKRFMNSAENDKPDPSCPCRNAKKIHNNDIDSLASSKLLEALFANGVDVNTIYDAYAATSDRRRGYNVNRDRSSHRSKSIKENLLDLGSSDMDEDY